MSQPPTPSHRRLAWAFRAGLGGLALLLAVAVFWGLYRTRPVVEHVQATAAQPTVAAFRAATVAVQRQWTGYGTVQALDSAEIRARVTATVLAIPEQVQAGQRVAAGQLLVQLDDADFDRQLDVARQRIAEIDAALDQLAVEESLLGERLSLADTQVSIARSEYDRQVSLRQRDVNNAQNVDAAQRTLITAQQNRLQLLELQRSIPPRRSSLQAQRASQLAQVNLAELSQQRTRITSPIDGVIQSLDVEVGENLMAGQQQVARVVAIDRVEVPIKLAAAARQEVVVGDRVVLRPTGPLGRLPLAGWETQIRRIAPEADTATRTFTVYAELEQSADRAMLPAPGMFLRATVYADATEDRFVVPRSSINADRIQLVRDQQLVSQPVEVLYTIAQEYPSFGLAVDQWAVLEDPPFTADELVVTNAASQLPDGTRVTVRLPPSSAHPSSPPAVDPGTDGPTESADDEASEPPSSPAPPAGAAP